MWNDNAAMAPTPSTLANGGIGRAATTQSLPLDELAKRLEAAREKATQCAQRVRTIADLLFGSQPQPESAGNTIKPSPNGRMSGLNDQADVVLYWLSELESQLRRLDQVG